MNFYGLAADWFPKDNYIVMIMQSFGAGNYVVIDLDLKSVKNFSPYPNHGLQNEHKLKKEDIHEIEAILNLPDFGDIKPEHNIEHLEYMDGGEWIYFHSKVNTMYMTFTHVSPNNKVVRRIISLYYRLNDTQKN